MPLLESSVMPGLPLQVVCYERADDIGFGVSGVVTRARSIRASFPGARSRRQSQWRARSSEEKVLYLLDPIGASRRSAGVKAWYRLLPRSTDSCRYNHALNSPTPAFLHKQDGLVLSIGQFNQWVGSQLMASGLVQIWPGMPVAHRSSKETGSSGVQVADQGTDQARHPAAGLPARAWTSARL